MHQKQENPFLNLGFNIILPVILLNKGQDYISSDRAPIYVLILALAFPFFYGLFDLVSRKKINVISIIGLVSVGLTGGLALMELEGVYFAIKEASVPLLFAVIAAGSVFVKKPLATLLIFKSSLFDTGLIQSQLQSRDTEKDFEKLMNHSTFVLAGSFILSAVLNFIIAIYVFKDIDSFLPDATRKQIINEQVADMTWMGYVFIALPLTFVTGFLMWWILKRLKDFTGLNLEELIPQVKK